jgi:hypothetical protein
MTVVRVSMAAAGTTAAAWAEASGADEFGRGDVVTAAAADDGTGWEVGGVVAESDVVVVAEEDMAPGNPDTRLLGPRRLRKA